LNYLFVIVWRINEYQIAFLHTLVGLPYILFYILMQQWLVVLLAAMLVLLFNVLVSADVV